MSDASDDILLFKILRQIQEGQATAGAALTPLVRAVVRHDRKFGEIDQWSRQIGFSATSDGNVTTNP